MQGKDHRPMALAHTPADTLQIGYILPILEGWLAGGTARWSDLAEQVRAAEAVGFDSVWIPDHLLYRFEGLEPFGIWECWSLVAAVAAITERIQIGTIVAVTSFRNPALFAKMVDTADEICDGRLILGLGAGSHEPEYAAFGYEWQKRVSHFDEAIQIIHGLLRSGVIDFYGAYYQARDCELRPRGPRPQGPPFMVGTRSPRMLRLTARYADDWNIAWRHTVEDVVAQYPLGQEACAAVGRDFATLSTSAALQIDLPGKRGYAGRASMAGARSAAIGGTYAEIAATLRAYQQAGVSHIQCWIDPSTPHGIEEFGRVLELVG
jgi:alkanesulfonate monooxygenase SsuD/methylene tetrahydromethanopterin reductase-like flavin-dependent oxidoreductase (luciferase family)